MEICFDKERCGFSGNREGKGISIYNIYNIKIYYIVII